MVRIQIEIPQEEIAAFCKTWQVEEFALFGSVLREDFRPDSDIDVLVEFMPEARWSLFDMAKMVEALQKIFGRKVDLLVRSTVEQSPNWIRRKSILESAQVIHHAA